MSLADRLIHEHLLLDEKEITSAQKSLIKKISSHYLSKLGEDFGVSYIDANPEFDRRPVCKIYSRFDSNDEREINIILSLDPETGDVEDGWYEVASIRDYDGNTHTTEFISTVDVIKVIDRLIEEVWD